jgi:hypothetical protein
MLETEPRNFLMIGKPSTSLTMMHSRSHSKCGVTDFTVYRLRLKYFLNPHEGS